MSFRNLLEKKRADELCSYLRSFFRQLCSS